MKKSFFNPPSPRENEISMFIKSVRTLEQLPRLHRELDNAVAAANILHNTVPTPSLDEISMSLSFPNIGKRDEFLDKVITESAVSLDKTLIRISGLIGQLHRHKSPIAASPERMPAIPLSLDHLDTIGVEVGKYVCESSSDSYTLPTEGNCFIHGDLTLDNIHLNPVTKEVSIVDWELSGNGFPEDDISSLISSLISLTLLRISTSGISKSAFAHALLEVYELVHLFVCSYEKNTNRHLNTKLLTALTREKLRCRTMVALHMFGMHSIQFKVLKAASARIDLGHVYAILNRRQEVSE